MIEVQVDPLGHVQFVLVVPLADRLNHLVSILAHGCDDVILHDRLELVFSVRERQIDHLNQGLHDVQLSHQLLSKLEVALLHLELVILLF